jgi:hypothetical protein
MSRGINITGKFNIMEEKESAESSWTLPLLVTSASFFIFSGIVKFLNGEHAGLFFCVSVVSLVLGVFSFLKNYINSAR